MCLVTLRHDSQALLHFTFWFYLWAHRLFDILLHALFFFFFFFGFLLRTLKSALVILLRGGAIRASFFCLAVYGIIISRHRHRHDITIK